MKEKKEKRGRPKKQLTDLPPDWEKKIVELMKIGGSEVEVRATILNGISEDLYYRFLKEEELFSQTIKKGRLLSQAWWERQGRENLKERAFNPVLWYMNMKNRFGWKDRQDTETPNMNGHSTFIKQLIDTQNGKVNEVTP